MEPTRKTSTATAPSGILRRVLRPVGSTPGGAVGTEDNMDVEILGCGCIVQGEDIVEFCAEHGWEAAEDERAERLTGR